MNTLTIVSTPALKVGDDEKVISWARRSTEKTPVAVDQRYRGVTLKASALKVPNEACNSKFHMLLQNTVYDLANARFIDWVKDNMMQHEMDEELLTLDSVLMFWAEERQRQVIDGDSIKAWLLKSYTYTQNLGEKQQLAWARTVPKIAAPGYRGLIAKDIANAILAKIAEEDHEHPACVFIMQRLNNITEAAPEDADAY